MERALAATFVTPIDREDIHALVRSLDDVMDAIDAKADARGLLIAMKDLRLANDAKAAESAKEFLEAR